MTSWLRRAAAICLLLTAAACARSGEPSLPDDAVQSQRGIWIGKSQYETMGAVSVHRADDEALILIEDGFVMPPIPGTVIAFGRDGFIANAIVGTVRRPSGKSVYAVPGRLRPADYNELWLWDPRQNRPVGIARLRSS